MIWDERAFGTIGFSSLLQVNLYNVIRAKIK